MRRRMYRTGMGFAFWRWTDIRTDGRLYLRRLHIIQVPKVGAVMLHWIKRPDISRDLHDHPVSFLSVVLRGSYLEERGEHGSYNEVRWLNYVRATDRHRIVATEQPLLTLVFAGPKVRTWGFWTPSGFVPWTEYDMSGNTKLDIDERTYEDK